MEVTTRKLDTHEWDGLIRGISNLLEASGVHNLRVEYGWGCALDVADLWKEQSIPARDLHAFVADSQEKGLIKLGSSDVIIRDEQGVLTIRLCHESDIHFLSADTNVINQVLGFLNASRTAAFESEDGKSWKPVESSRSKELC